MIPAILPLLLVAGAASADAGSRPPRQMGVPIGQGTTTPTVTLTAPAGGWSVDRMMRIEGVVSDATVDPVIVSINGARYLMRTQGGHFGRSFPTAAGQNVVTVSATNHGGTGTAQAVTFGQVPPVPLKAILTSDTDGVYTDLHIYEPTDDSVDADGNLVLKKMQHVFWARTSSPSGGTFFLNEQGGDFDDAAYGPYLYIHRAPPNGVYVIVTNYWPSGDKAHTLATLNLSLFEGTPQEVRRMARVPLATRGTTRVLAFVNILGADQALVYVPAQDPLPTDPRWPRNLSTFEHDMQKVDLTVGDFGD